MFSEHVDKKCQLLWVWGSKVNAQTSSIIYLRSFTWTLIQGPSKVKQKEYYKSIHFVKHEFIVSIW